MTITHEELMRQTSAVDPNGVMLAFVGNDPASVRAVLNKASVNPEFAHVLTASIMLYRVNCDTLAFLETLIEALELVGREDMIDAINTVCASLNTAKRCAIEGLENIAPLKNNSI